MRIPKRFKLASIPVEIEIDNDFAKKHQCAGQSLYAEQKIIIDATAMPIESTLETLAHEAVHWILFIMNEHKLRNNEKFVDTFAHLLTQALTTMEYEE